MYLKAVKYKGVWLAPGSESIKLYEDKKFKELDKLQIELDKAKAKLEGVPYVPSTAQAKSSGDQNE